MPRNGAGTYVPPASTWNPGVNNVTATTADFNALLTDLSAGLTQSVSNDGQTPMAANLPMGNNKLTGLALGSANTDSASMANLYALAGQAGGTGDRNLLVNSNFSANQRTYVSGTATTVANQVTLDRWRVVTSGQNLTYGTATPDVTVTAPAGGLEQIIEAGWVAGGVYTLSWTGTATATVNGVSITNGGQTSSLTGNSAVTIRFSSGTVTRAQFELGTVATPWQRRAPGVDLLLCQREYAKNYAFGTAPGSTTTVGRFTGSGNVGGFISYTVRLPVAMRTIPTVTLWDTSANINCVITSNSAGTPTSRSASAINITEQGFEVSTSLAGTDIIMTGMWAAATGF